MSRRFSRAALALLTLLAPATTVAAPAFPGQSEATAQSAAGSPEPRLELALLAGRRAGGLLRVDTGSRVPLDVGDAGAVGGRAGWRLGPLVTLQAEYFRQSTSLLRRPADGRPVPVADVTIEYLQAGPRFRLSRGAVQPYLNVGAGVMRMRSRNADASDTFVSLSAGPGLMLPLSSHVGLTGDLRFFASLVGRNTAVPCQRPEAGCLRTGNDTVLLQLHALAGLTVRF